MKAEKNSNRIKQRKDEVQEFKQQKLNMKQRDRNTRKTTDVDKQKNHVTHQNKDGDR